MAGLTAATRRFQFAGIRANGLVLEEGSVMTTQSPEIEARLESASQLVLNGLRDLVSTEVQRVANDLLKNLPKPESAAPAESVDLEQLRHELESSEAFTDHINKCLQEGLKNIMPGLIKRLKPESVPVDPTSIIASVEMKEMLEERFRQMLLYLKQEVIPKEVSKAIKA